jgi:hypothetical protein
LITTPGGAASAGKKDWMAGAGGACVGDGGRDVEMADGPQEAIVNKTTAMTDDRFLFILSPSSETGR